MLAHTETRKSRVLVAAAGLCLGLVLLWLRCAWLQIVCHEHYAERADRIQEQRVLLEPVRGNLLDRRGRVLARDLQTYSISAAPREMKDPRATARALAAILDQPARKLERAFAERPRFLWVARRVPPEIGQRVAALRARGLYLSTETRRVYPLGPATVEMLGRTDLDNVGVEALELQFDGELRGRAGWATLFRDGRGRAHRLPRGLRRAPEDGREVVLTLDADLQAIVESHLAAAVDTLHATRGCAIFLDPRTGEVLASAVVPHLAAAKSRNWAITDTYEPGSTFKTFVAGAAIEDGLSRPDQVYEASASGVARVAPGAVFTDIHEQASFTLRDAIRWSSNIVMGKLGLIVGPERLYRYATSLGFGSITGVDFPGEAGGKLRPPDRWSARSASTIAIGHEIAVTPLQLALAYSAVANGGVLMRPMVAREVRESNGDVVRRFRPEAVQRVFSASTTAMLRDMLLAVVDSGTAKSARVGGMRVAGKTGTTKKFDAAAGRYGRVYLSSFVGFAPADDPSLVGVVVIDEPRGKHYYGGEVAAPVFGRVVADARALPQGPFASTAAVVAMRPPAPAPVVVPDLRLLPPRAAERTLAAHALRARFRGEGARVLAQAPPAGTAVERGARVEVWLSTAGDPEGNAMPDLTGLAVREALRRLGLRQVQARIVGRGTVVRQEPAAGTTLPLDGPCTLFCEPRLPAVAPEPARNAGRPARVGDPLAALAGTGP